MFPERKTHNQIDNILIDRRKHSSIIDFQSFRAAGSDTHHCLVVAKCWERLAVNKQRSRQFHIERFSLKNLKAVEGKEQYQVEVSKQFAALEDLDGDVDSNSALESIREDIKILAKESLNYHVLKEHKPWFDE
jgi:hypothetical protein